jgi:hypothetical protein
MSDIFAQDQGTTTTPLEELVGEGKKFADVQALAVGKKESDAFITQLQEENRVAMEALNAREQADNKQQTVADLIAAVKATPEENEPTKAMSPEELQELVRATVTGDSAKATAEANRQLGNALVLEKLGGDVEAAKAFVTGKARELGTTPAALAELSEQAPKAFAKLMEVPDKNVPEGSLQNLPAQHDLNPSGTVMEIEGHKTHAYYRAQKKEMGAARWISDRALQKAMLADGLALGDRFKQS